MKIKRIILGTIVVLGLSVLFHSVYDLFPNKFTALIFPINESIWEHNKMILLAFFVWALGVKIFGKNKESIFFKTLIELILCILILDITFTPFFLYVLNTKDNMVITIIWYIVSIVLSLIIGEKYFTVSKNKTLERNSLIGFLLIQISFMILTYNPLNLPIFYEY